MKPPYFNSNKPPIPPNAASRLIIPSALPFDVEITAHFNTQNGNTELRIKQLSSATRITYLQVAGVLSEHVTSLMRQIVQGNISAVPVPEQKPETTNGEAINGNQPQA